MKTALVLAALAAALACGVGAGPPGDDAGARLPAGRGPGSLALADLNGDGRLDLVVANDDSGDVTILLGDGKGAFVAASGSPFPAGKSPNDIAIADFDGDGKPDLAFPNHDTSHVTILLGDGRGRFRPAPASPVTVRSKPHPHGIAAADFDGDGHVDFAVESWANDQIEVIHGTGAGRFRTPGQLFGVGHMPYQKLRAGDVNGDGVPDIVTTNFEGGNVTVLLGNGKGGFREAPGSPFPAGEGPFSLALADVDRDGHLDLVVSNFSGRAGDTSHDAVNVLLGDGRGGFRPMKGTPFAHGREPRPRSRRRRDRRRLAGHRDREHARRRRDGLPRRRTRIVPVGRPQGRGERAVWRGCGRHRRRRPRRDFRGEPRQRRRDDDPVPLSARVAAFADSLDGP